MSKEFEDLCKAAEFEEVREDVAVWGTVLEVHKRGPGVKAMAEQYFAEDGKTDFWKLRAAMLKFYVTYKASGNPFIEFHAEDGGEAQLLTIRDKFDPVGVESLTDAALRLNGFTNDKGEDPGKK